ncbi:MAG: tetratricopeptide repeat protein [Caldilineaceae bacterium]|nr:tetratricopeptide repeat protein [Caldilineaceae bacterium]
MAYTVESQTNTPANQLRDALDKAERLVVQVSGQNVEELLLLLDQIEQRFDQLSNDGIDLRPEEVRWQSLLNRLDSKPERIVSAAAGGLAELRRRHPPADSFWWQLDGIVVDRRKRAIKRGVITLGGLVIAVALMLWGINFFFPPDPQAVAMVEATNQIDRLTAEQRWDEALTVVQQARQQLPDEPELAVWEAVLYERLGNAEGAAAALEEAKALFGENPVQLWITLGNDRMMVGDLDGADAAAQQAAALAPDEPMVTFLQGGIAEARGDIPRAIELFQKTSDLAGDDNAQLNVIARVRMGNLLQRPDAFTSPAATPTASPTPTP